MLKLSSLCMYICIVTLATLILIQGIIIPINSVIKTNPDEFEFQILGGYGSGTFIPGPCPPGLTEPCTWDSWGFTGLACRIVWRGLREVKIVSISCWQNLSIHGIHWIYTGPLIVPVPSFNLSRDDFHDFRVNGSFVSSHFLWVEIKISTYEKFGLSDQVSIGLTHLTTWPLSTSKLSTSKSLKTAGWPYIMLIPVVLSIITVRRIKRRN